MNKIISVTWELILYLIYHFFSFIAQLSTRISKKIKTKIKLPHLHFHSSKFKKLRNKIYDLREQRYQKKSIKIKKSTNIKKGFNLKNKLSQRQYETFLGYSFISPWLLGALIFTVYPVISVIRYSFDKVIITTNGVKTGFIGLESYTNIFLVNNAFKDGLLEVFQTLIIQLPIIIVISIFFATLLNAGLKANRFFQAIFFLPVIILSGTVIVLLEETKLFGAGNLIDSELYQLIVSYDNFFLNIILYLLENIETILWFSAIPTLIFLVILHQLNDDLYEAADMDGASINEKFWKITLPQLKMGINISIIYLVMYIGTFSSNPVVKEIQEKMFSIQHGLGYASAEALIYMILLLIVITILLIIVNGVPKRRKEKRRKKQKYHQRKEVSNGKI